MPINQPPGAHRQERVRRSPTEIAHVLEILAFRKERITAHLQAGELQFTSQLLVIDPARSFIILDASADEAAKIMLDNGFRHVPIVDEGRAVGIVSIRDVARWSTEES